MKAKVVLLLLVLVFSSMGCLCCCCSGGGSGYDDWDSYYYETGLEGAGQLDQHAQKPILSTVN